MSKTVGRLVPQKVVDLPARFDAFMLGQDAFNQRLGIIPNEVAPSNIEDITSGAAKGNLGPLYEMYRKMEVTDPRFGGLVHQFLSTISGLDLKVIAPEGLSESDKRLAEDYRALVEENLAVLDTHQMVIEYARAHVTGVKVFENRFEVVDFPYGKRLALIKEQRPVSLSALAMDTKKDSPTRGELLLRLKGSSSPGTPLSRFDPAKVNVLEAQHGRGFYDTLGAARRCMALWVTKIYALMWWTEWLETYGQGTRIARYPTNATPRTRATIERFLQTLGKNAYGLFPEGVDIQLIESTQSGQMAPHERIIQMCNTEMAVTLIGQAETTGEQKYGSRAKATVLNGVRYEILRSVVQLVRRGFYQFVRSLILVNYGEVNERLLPVVQPLLVNPADLKEKVEAINALQREGTPIPLDYVYEQTAVSKPRPGEKVLIGGQILIVNEEGALEALSAEVQQQSTRAAEAAPQPADA